MVDNQLDRQKEREQTVKPWAELKIDPEAHASPTGLWGSAEIVQPQSLLLQVNI